MITNLPTKRLLQIYYRVRQRKAFENRLIFGEVVGKSLMFCFLTQNLHRVKLRYRIDGHDTTAILWVKHRIMCGINSRFAHGGHF